MRNVLEFLERVGQDWQLRHAEPAVLASALAQAGIDSTMHAAILQADSRQLQSLLELSANVCCAVHPAHEDEDEDLDEDDDLDDEDFDDDEDDEDDEDFDADEDEGEDD